MPVIRCLYDAALDGEKWPVFLQAFATAFEAKGAHVIRVQPHDRMLEFSALHGYDDYILRGYGRDATDFPGALARFERHFAELLPTDPRARFLERFPSRPLSCRLEIDEAELHGSKIYRDMLGAADVEYSLLVSLAEEDGSLIMLGVFRGKQSRHFDQAEVDAFGALIPHVKQAIGLSEHLTRLSVLNHAVLAVLDDLSMGFLLVGDGAHLVHANAAGRRILRLADGISLQHGSLRLHGADDHAKLRRLVHEALAGACLTQFPPSQAMMVTRPSGREPMPVIIGALRGAGSERRLGPLHRPLALLLVSLPEEPQEPPVELLRRLFGFTQAEARVCERLVQGAAVKDIAGELGITVETVRVHLKNMFAKTGTGKQAELVAKVMAMPVWLHRHAGSQDDQIEPSLDRRHCGRSEQ